MSSASSCSYQKFIPRIIFHPYKKKIEKGLCYDFNSLTEIPRFLSDEECEHIISLAKESGLVMSIAGFDVAAYEGDLDEDMREAGKTAFFSIDNQVFHERIKEVNSWEGKNK